MTEEEAKTKWCPHARIARQETDDGASWNRVQSDLGTTLPIDAWCVGSRCMAWRWMSEHHLEPSGVEDGMDIAADGRVTMNGQRLGFCGLAGAPQ